MVNRSQRERPNKLTEEFALAPMLMQSVIINIQQEKQKYAPQLSSCIVDTGHNDPGAWPKSGISQWWDITTCKQVVFHVMLQMAFHLRHPTHADSNQIFHLSNDTTISWQASWCHLHQPLKYSACDYSTAVSYTHLTLPTNREV